MLISTKANHIHLEPPKGGFFVGQTRLLKSNTKSNETKEIKGEKNELASAIL